MGGTRRERSGGPSPSRTTRSIFGSRGNAGQRAIGAARDVFARRSRDRQRAAQQRVARARRQPVATPIERPSEVPRGRPARRAPGTELRKRPIVSPPLPPDINIPTPGEPPVSIHKQLLGIARDRILERARGAPSRPAMPGVGVSQASVLALPAPVLAAGGRIGAAVFGRVGTALGIGAAVGSFFARNSDGSCPVGTHPIKQDGVHGAKGSYCVRNRRMNVGNARAARRSVRRLKGARKLLRDIEKMMPTKTSRRRAPVGHAAHLHHTGGS